MFSIFDTSIEDKIYTIVKKLPEEVKQNLLTEINKLELMMRADKLSYKGKAKKPTMDEICKLVRKVRTKRYNEHQQ